MRVAIRYGAAALAALAGLQGAHAQSTLAIAGRVDVGPQFIDDGSTRQRRIDSGTYTSSRVIFRGTEDLGDGLTAGFYLEHRFNADLGAQQSAAKFWNAGSQVRIESKSWGSVTLGRQYVPMFWSFLFADDTGPLRLHGYSALQSVQRSAFARVRLSATPLAAGARPVNAGTPNSLDSVNAAGIYTLGATSAFEDNQIIYKTPSLGGATVMLAAGAGEGAPSGSGRVLGGNVEYKGGPFYGSLAYNQKRGMVPAGGSGGRQTVTEALASGMYDIVDKTFKVWGNVHPWKLETVASELKGHDWMLGLSYWFGKNEVWANYARKTIDSCTACNSRGFGVGYHYLLSKRTELYASIAQVGNDANSGNQLNGFAPAALGQKVKGYAVGLAHTF